jgi:glycosyltransferase involved in cell wall biosynthesis
MRVVMAAHAYPRHPGDVAGNFIARIAETLVAGGHTVAAVAPADRGNARRFTLGGVDVRQVRYAAAEREDLAYSGDMAAKARGWAGRRAFLGLVTALEQGVREAIRDLHADVVHAFWWIPGGWAATRATTAPIVVSLMGTDVALLRGPARLLGRRVLGRARRVTAISRYLAAEARRRTFRPRLPVDLIPMPADTARFTRASRGGGGIATLGRLTTQKRVDLLLDAVHQAGLDVPVTIVGDGPARAALEAQARALGLSRVRFLGALPDAAAQDAIGDADVFAMLGRGEGLGLAAAEALMLGIPVVVAEDGGGVLDLVTDGPGGCVVAPTARAVGQALRTMRADPAARAAARAEGDRLRARLSPRGIADRFVETYAGCV